MHCPNWLFVLFACDVRMAEPPHMDDRKYVRMWLLLAFLLTFYLDLVWKLLILQEPDSDGRRAVPRCTITFQQAYPACVYEWASVAMAYITDLQGIMTGRGSGAAFQHIEIFVVDRLTPQFEKQIVFYLLASSQKVEKLR